MCRERSISFSAIESREKSRFNINFLSSISSVSNLLLTSKAPIAIQNPCIPSPCGPYSQCRETNGHAICSCIENCIGSPPACRPECTLSSECFLDKACINQKCVNPCVAGTCGENARCQIINHNPICSCSLGYTGDPFIRCTPEESKLFWCSFFLRPFLWQFCVHCVRIRLIGDLLKITKASNEKSIVVPNYCVCSVESISK